MNPWGMPCMAYKLGNIEMKYRRKRNACIIYGGEILKYLRKRSTYIEDLGHDVRTNYRKIIAAACAVRLGGLAPARPINEHVKGFD